MAVLLPNSLSKGSINIQRLDDPLQYLRSLKPNISLQQFPLQVLERIPAKIKDFIK
ncbi:MAG: hypothetical protein RMY34_31360 [Aulosira sp. DedQUE10]|nr:hypothetical protein [Aulosira sp. DedQUE10]